MSTLLAYVVMITLHNVDGDEITINVDHIVALTLTKESKGGQNELMAGGLKCILSLENGKMISVIEPCGMVRQAIRQAQQDRTI